MHPDPVGGLYPYDYCYLWAAGRLALEGRDVYDRELLAQTMHHVGWPESEGIWGFTHPPWTLWAYLPFSVFSYPVARILWMVLLVGLFALVVVQSRKLAKACPELMGRLPFPLFLFSLVLFPPVLKIFAFGQCSLLLSVGLLLFCRYFIERNLFSAGLALSLTLLKPHLLVPLYCALAVFSLRKKELRLGLGVAVGVLSQQALCSILYPEGLGNFLKFLPTLAENSRSLLGATPTQVAATFWGFDWLRPVLITLGILVGGAFGLESRFSLPALAHRLIPISLLVAPYCFSHEFILLIPAYLSVVACLFARYGEKIKYPILLSALLMIAVFANLKFEFLTLLIPLGLLVLSYFPPHSKDRVSSHTTC